MRTIILLALASASAVLPALGGGDPGGAAGGGTSSIPTGRGIVAGNPMTDLFGTAGAPALSPFASGMQAFALPAVGLAPGLRLQDADPPAGEKSAWLAAVMSLAVPGAGEIYAGSYLKGAAFLAAEAAMWGFAWSFDSQGDDLTDEYKRYANDYWSATRYVDWTLNHLGSLNPDLTTSAAEYHDLIYPEDEPPCDPPFSCVDWQALNAMERDVASGRLNGYTHVLPYYGEQQYYELIGKYEQFSRGWDDSGVLNPELENNVPIRSTSAKFFEYARMRARANDKYSVASTFVSLAVVNHVLSALDAFWSVTRYNKSLHANVRIRMEQSPLGRVPVTTANFRYDF